MPSQDDLLQEIEQLKKQRDAYAQALTTSNSAFMDKVKEFSIIKRLADSLKEGIDLHRVSCLIIDIIIDETAAENCSLWLMDRTKNCIALHAARGQDDYETTYYPQGQGSRLQVGQGAAGWVAKTGESLLIEDVANSPYFLPGESDQNIRSLLCLPIRVSDEVLGVLNMSHPDIGIFSNENERVLRLITDQAAVGLKNFFLFQEVETFNRQLEEMVEERTSHLQNSEERYERAIKAGRVGIWDWQVGAAQIFVAPNLKAMLGYREDELTTIAEWTQCVEPEDREAFNQTLQQYLHSNNEAYEVEHRMRHRDGHIIWFHVRGAPIRDAKGTVVRISGSNTDITIRKQAEAELARAQEEALVNAHAAGKAEFATTVLHNIGNVLNSVNVDSLHIRKTLESMRLPQFVLACQLLLDNQKDLATFLTSDPRGQKLPEYLTRVSEVIAKEAGGISRLSDSIGNKIDLMRDIIETQQNYATANSGAQRQELVQLVEEALKVQHNSLTKRHVVLKQNFNQVNPVVVNASKLIHVVINLLKNAVEAMEKTPNNQRILQISIDGDQDKVVLKIKDHGMGISAENMPKMFTHGFTTKKQGHGFGLHYCARTIEAMGGTIAVESEGPNKGATFTLTFPADVPFQRIPNKTVEPITSKEGELGFQA